MHYLLCKLMSLAMNLQANSSIPILRQNIDMPVKLGSIFFTSIAQNQSYAVAGMPSNPDAPFTASATLLFTYQ